MSPRRLTTWDATQSARIVPTTPVGVSFQLVWRRGGLTIRASRSADSRTAARTSPSAACFNATYDPNPAGASSTNDEEIYVIAPPLSSMAGKQLESGV